MNKIIFHFMLLLMLASAHAEQPASPNRLDEVAERGSHVMPFALDKTLHVFTKNATGGIQQVVAKQAGDNEQISLIRGHLRQLAEHFSQGDFSGPMRIHGETMPGVEALRADFKQVQFVYRDLPDGAELAYSSSEPNLIAAIHRYFAAQLNDHAHHAHHAHQQPTPKIAKKYLQI